MKAGNPICEAAVAAGFKITAPRGRMIECLRRGEEFVGAARRGQARLDAPFIRWICATGEIAPFVDAHGLAIAGVTIVGTLDLDFVRCAFPVKFENCTLETFTARAADLPVLHFVKCRLEEFIGDNIRVGQSLILRESTVQRGVLLRAATIGANVRLAGTRIHKDAYGQALGLDGATIGGSLWMNGGFRADGFIRLESAHIKKNLEVDGAIVAPRAYAALHIESSRIGGSLLLRHGFRCLGQVRIYGTRVEEGIDLQGARIAASGRYGLVLEWCNSARGFIIRGERQAPYRSFRCVGGVSLTGSVTDGDVDFSEAVVLARGRPAANFSRLRCDGQFVCRDSKLDGPLVLRNTTVKNDVGVMATLIEPREGPAILAAGHHCGGTFWLNETVARGQVEFHNLFVGGNLFATDAKFGSDPADQVLFLSARIGGEALFKSNEMAGPLVLDYCTIGTRLVFRRAKLAGLSAKHCVVGADLVLSEAQLRPPARDLPAADLSGLRCQGSLVLDQLDCEGTFDFSRSVLAGLVGHGAQFVHSAALAIAGSHAQVHGQLQLTDSRIEGAVRLERILVSAALDLSGSSIESSEDIALDLTEARIGGTLNLAHGFKAGPGAVNLSFTDVATLHDDPEHWPQPRALRIEGLTYRNIVPLDQGSRINWLQRWRPADEAADRDCSWQPYEQLMEALRRHGREADRLAVAIEKQRVIGRSNARRLKRWRSAAYGATIRYGYRPQRALVFAPFFIGLSIVVFLAGADTLMVPTNDAARIQWAADRTLPAGYPSFNAAAYAVDSFVPIVSLQQRDAWRPDDRATCRPGLTYCGALLRILLWLNVAFGWIVTTLVVAGFTGLIRKE